MAKVEVDYSFLTERMSEVGMTATEMGTIFDKNSSWLSNAKGKGTALDEDIVNKMATILRCRPDELKVKKASITEFDDVEYAINLLREKLIEVSNSVIRINKRTEEMATDIKFMKQLPLDSFDVARIVINYMIEKSATKQYSDSAMTGIKNSLGIDNQTFDLAKSDLGIKIISQREGRNNQEVRYWKKETGYSV